MFCVYAIPFAVTWNEYCFELLFIVDAKPLGTDNDVWSDWLFRFEWIGIFFETDGFFSQVSCSNSHRICRRMKLSSEISSVSCWSVDSKSIFVKSRHVGVRISCRDGATVDDAWGEAIRFCRLLVTSKWFEMKLLFESCLLESSIVRLVVFIDSATFNDIEFCSFGGFFLSEGGGGGWSTGFFEGELRPIRSASFESPSIRSDSGEEKLICELK